MVHSGQYGMFHCWEMPKWNPLDMHCLFCIWYGGKNIWHCQNECPLLAWIFLRSLKSARHKSNCERKALHDKSNRRCTESGNPPTKRLKQTVLSFATKNLSECQVSDQICGRVCPSMSSGTQDDARILTVGILDCKNQNSHVCNRIFAHKDLRCAGFQEGIKYYQKYFNQNGNRSENQYKFDSIDGASSVLSLFNKDCNGKCLSVK